MALWDPQTWDWATLSKTVVGAGVGTALVQGLLPLYRDWHHRKSQAAYMAMRLAVTLEFYASACADFIQENANVQPPEEGEFPGWEVELPELPAYPDDADGWRAIDRTLAGRCLNLRNRLLGSQRIINSTIEHSDVFHVDDVEGALDEQAARRGLEAWKLAVALRRKHSVEEAETVWDYAETLESTLRTAEKAKRKRQESNPSSSLP